MLGLAFFFLSALTIALYVAWLSLLVWMVRKTTKVPAVRVPAVLVGVLLALLPLSGALVRPLMESACDEHGRVVQIGTAPSGASDLVVTGKHYTSDHAIDLFADRQLTSIHLEAGAEFGDARRIATTAVVHDGRAFSLRPSKPDDPACAPYYDLLARAERLPKGYSGLCVAYGYDPLPGSYVLLSELQRREQSWRTAFYPIDWKGLQMQRVSPTGSATILEVREFEHGGIRFPILLGVMPLGSFSCRAGKGARAAVAAVVPPNPVRHGPEAYSKEQLAEQIALLEERFWGFPFPQEVHAYNISIFDHGKYAAGEKGLKLVVDVHQHERPVLLKVHSNAKADWSIARHSANQMVLVETLSTGEPQRVQGVPEAHVWSSNKDQPAESPLMRFYLGKVMGTTIRSITAQRHCALSQQAMDMTTTIEVKGCPLLVK